MTGCGVQCMRVCVCVPRPRRSSWRRTTILRHYKWECMHLLVQYRLAMRILVFEIYLAQFIPTTSSAAAAVTAIVQSMRVARSDSASNSYSLCLATHSNFV